MPALNTFNARQAWVFQHLPEGLEPRGFEENAGFIYSFWFYF